MQTEGASIKLETHLGDYGHHQDCLGLQSPLKIGKEESPKDCVQVPGISCWNKSIPWEAQISLSGKIQDLADSSTAAVFLPEGKTLSKEEVTEVFVRIAREKAISRVEFLRFPEPNQMRLPGF